MRQSNEEIVKELDRLEKDTKALKDEALRICWYMRGSVSYNEAMLLSATDRKLINKIIKDNLETTKESRLPFF